MSGPTNYDSQGLEMFTEQRPAIVQLADLMDYINEMRDVFNETQQALQEAQSYHYFISVKEFGATGNGSTDDTTSIKNALLYASQNKTNVYFPRGSYKVTSTISIPTGVYLVGEGGWTQRTIFLQFGDFNLFELVGGYSSGGIIGIHISAFSNNGATNNAIYVKRTQVVLKDISIGAYKGVGINMDGSITEGTGSWFSKLERIKIVGSVVNNVYNTSKGIILGDNFNSSFLTDFTVHYCQTGIDIKTVNNIVVSKGNLSENKNIDGYGLKISEAGTNIKVSDIHFEGNENGILILKGNMIILENLICNGYNTQKVFIDIPSGSIAQNIFIEHCSSFSNTVADLRVDNYKTYLVQIINSSLRSTTPILNLNNSEIAITSFGVTKKDVNSLTPISLDATTTITTNTQLNKNINNLTVIVNSSTPVTVTMPTYTIGLRFKIINTRTAGTLNITGGQYQNFNVETGLITNTLQLYGLGSIELLSLGDRWVVLNQQATWTKI